MLLNNTILACQYRIYKERRISELNSQEVEKCYIAWTKKYVLTFIF